eukprot:8503170-Alexandrium_andersonii.AAC.1
MVDCVQPCQTGCGQLDNMETICKSGQNARAINLHLLVCGDGRFPDWGKLAESSPRVSDAVRNFEIWLTVG